MCSHTITFYALPCKYTGAEATALATSFKEYIDRGSDKHLQSIPVLVQDFHSAQFIVTKLVQLQRLQRELRRLRPRHPLIIIRHSWLIKALISGSIVDEFWLRRRAWCLYSLILEITDREGALPGNSSDETSVVSRTPRSDAAMPGNESGTDLEVVKITTHKNMKDWNGPDPLPSGKSPALLRRESTTDPSGRSFHGPTTTILAINKYACQRQTPLQTPNDGLIAKFQLMRLARELQCDSVGERAYSTIVASLRAVPFQLTSVNDVEGLEGCGTKTVSLIQVLWLPWSVSPG